MNESEPIVSDINNSMTDDNNLTILYQQLLMNLYLTESV